MEGALKINFRKLEALSSLWCHFDKRFLIPISDVLNIRYLMCQAQGLGDCNIHVWWNINKAYCAMRNTFLDIVKFVHEYIHVQNATTYSTTAHTPMKCAHLHAEFTWSVREAQLRGGGCRSSAVLLPL